MKDETLKHNKNGLIKDHCKIQPEPFKMGAGQVTIAGSLSGVVPAHLVEEGEQILFAIKPSIWFIIFYSAKVVLLVLALLFVTLNTLKYYADAPYWLPRYASQIAAIVIFFQLVIAVLEWVSRLYVLTDRRVIRIKGVFNIDVFEAPLVKIQNTYLTFALHERLVSVGTILFATAGTAGIEASWQNINQPLEVHERIRAAIREAHRRWPNGCGP
jgi:uncharacterized membrane protein YdbT with pleckstrin-like domain